VFRLSLWRLLIPLPLRIARAITRDPDVYPEPEAFKPERFLNPNGTLRDDVTLTSVFGFGKRVCPGRHYVDATLFIVAATVLSVFRIDKRCDSESAPFNFTYSGGLVRCVERFLVGGTWRANCYCFTKSSESVSMLYQSKG
jgi:hypothetical protein